MALQRESAAQPTRCLQTKVGGVSARPHSPLALRSVAALAPRFVYTKFYDLHLGRVFTPIGPSRHQPQFVSDIMHQKQRRG
ncbi:hypothetical protein V5799_007950 [Amblyomma americanum]|uniref:Uncharacterized protein n=1 Tax=Amblyomma americanum TaxID=6943 RepID=A0AAQ4FEK5_AMBAM